MILSEETIKTRACRMRRMRSLVRVKTDDRLFPAAGTLLLRLRASDLSACSQRNLLATLLSAWPAGRNSSLRARVSRYKSELQQAVSARDENGERKGRLRDTQITFRGIKKRFARELARWREMRVAGVLAIRRFLTLGLYATVVPKRCDFGDARLTRCAPRTPSNYLNMKTKQLVLTRFKTAKRYGELREELDPSFVEAIEITLRLWPRRYLFPGSKGLDAGITAKSFSDLVASTMHAYFGERLRCNDLRHLYISEFCDGKSKCYAERSRLAKSMLHSVGQQLRYEQFR